MKRALFDTGIRVGGWRSLSAKTTSSLSLISCDMLAVGVSIVNDCQLLSRQIFTPNL